MVSHRLLSISSVFGGKNSKEIAGARCPFSADDVTSVMAPRTPNQAARGQAYLQEAKIEQIGQTNSPSEVGNCPLLPIISDYVPPNDSRWAGRTAPIIRSYTYLQ